ncbi:MAG TPA: tetratricopeptide repeat protein [Euryarchaeota archaeon]|nr:tetratricopeptide repeat protein [Euryarchaeota archaeon]
MKEVDRALTHLDRAILKDPRSPDAIYNKGRILFYEKKYAESIRMLEKLVKLEPARDDVRYFLELVNQMKA